MIPKHITDPEAQKRWLAGCVKGGLLQGDQNRKNGHWARISQQSPDDRIKAAKKGGAVAVETGQILTIRTADASYRGGLTQGANAVASGQWAEAQPMGLHIRWHVLRDRKKDSKYCFWCDDKNAFRTIPETGVND